LAEHLAYVRSHLIDRDRQGDALIQHILDPQPSRGVEGLSRYRHLVSALQGSEEALISYIQVALLETLEGNLEFLVAFLRSVLEKEVAYLSSVLLPLEHVTARDSEAGRLCLTGILGVSGFCGSLRYNLLGASVEGQ